MAAPKGGKRPSTPYRPPKKANTGLIIVIVVAAVAVVAIVAGVIAAMSSGGDEVEGLSQTQPVVVGGAPLPQFETIEGDPAVGTAPPVLEGRRFDGTPIAIDPGDGQPKVVIFLAHWCPHCQAEVPRIVEWQREGKIPDGVDIYGVATGTQSSRDNYPPSEWLDEEGWTFPTMADSEQYQAAEAWGLSTYPYFVAVGADGNVVARVSGELSEEQFVAFVNLAKG